LALTGEGGSPYIRLIDDVVAAEFWRATAWLSPLSTKFCFVAFHFGGKGGTVFAHLVGSPFWRALLFDKFIGRKRNVGGEVLAGLLILGSAVF
jgi:hypothetical protein